MPMPARGKRITVTVRLPYDEYSEMAKRAARKGWSLSDYGAWCIRKTLKTDTAHTPPSTSAVFAPDLDSVQYQTHGES